MTRDFGYLRPSIFEHDVKWVSCCPINPVVTPQENSDIAGNRTKVSDVKSRRLAKVQNQRVAVTMPAYGSHRAIFKGVTHCLVSVQPSMQSCIDQPPHLMQAL